MTNYTVRVELHGADGGDEYEDLHEAMRLQGFSRSINIDNVRYKLPTAEYSIVSDISAHEVLRKAQAAANSVQPAPQPSILVTGSAYPRVHSGLRRISS